MPPLLLGPPALSTFDNVVEVRDPNEMDIRSRVSERLLPEHRGCRYRLQDSTLLRTRFDDPITIVADQPMGCMLIAVIADRFAVQCQVGEDIDSYCFTAMLRGKASVRQGKNETTVTDAAGAAFRLSADTQALMSDDNTRQHLWITADALERALERMLGDRLHGPLEFNLALDWTRGLAASLKWQVDFLIGDMAHRDGVTDNPIALASFTDLILSLVLLGIPHNYLERLESRSRFSAIPAYVRRAEDFMHANAAVAIRMDQVADAAGCSIRTLEAVFRQFRETTPLAALHTIRLQHLRTELSQGAASRSPAEVARRYGFTNPGRFTAAYRRRFGEAPSETVRRGLHG